MSKFDAANGDADTAELAQLARGFAGHVKRAVRLGVRMVRTSRPARAPAGLVFFGIDNRGSGRSAIELLDNMIRAMGWPRDQVDVCALADHASLRVESPRIVIALGAQATEHLFGSGANAVVARGTWQRWQDMDVMPTFHPDELLAHVERKRAAWQDLQAVMARCAELGMTPRIAP